MLNRVLTDILCNGAGRNRNTSVLFSVLSFINLKKCMVKTAIALHIVKHIFVNTCIEFLSYVKRTPRI